MLLKNIAENLGAVKSSFVEVFSHFRYVLLAVIIFVFLFLVAIWLPNFSFIAKVITSSTFTLSQKASILFNSLGAFQSNFSPVARFFTLLIIALFAVNMSLLTFYLKNKAQILKEGKAGFGGILAGFLGIGCASCGSVILSSLFGFGFTSAFIAFLPLRGQEFSLLGAILLAFAVFQTAKKINQPLVCKK